MAQQWQVVLSITRASQILSISRCILLFAFSSHQIVTLFPKLYESGKDILLGNKEIIDVVTSAANSVIDSVGKTDIMDVVTNAANSVMESVVNATTVAGELAFNQTAQ